MSYLFLYFLRLRAVNGNFIELKINLLFMLILKFDGYFFKISWLKGLWAEAH